MSDQPGWNHEMDESWQQAEAWAAEPRTTVEQAMGKWMSEQSSSRQWEQER